jgi:hypothetical protein
MFSASAGNLSPGTSIVYLSTNQSFSIDAPSGAYYTATYQGETTVSAGQTAGLPALSGVTAFGGATAPAQSNMVLGNNQSPANYSFNGTQNFAPLCFLSGTHITTPSGEVLVEDLNIGDIISTVDGGSRKILWIGKHTLSSTFTHTKNLPVEITIGAFGKNTPARPLRVSPGHSLLVGGVFPIASALINDVTIRQLTKEELPEIFTYYHIEVEDHALILAEGVPAETFLDASSRRAFSNWSEYVELFGEEEREVPRSDLHYQRILKFDDLPQELKETIGYPLSDDEIKVA